MMVETKEDVDMKIEEVYKFLKTIKKFVKYFGVAGTSLLTVDQVHEIGSIIDLIIGSGIIGSVASIMNILKYKFNLKWMP